MPNRKVRQYLEYLKYSGISELLLKPGVLTSKPQPSRDESFSGNPGEILQKLEAQYSDCRKCGLWEGRKKFVYGAGNPRALLMLIGEGPGYYENEQGKPFVGKAGELLTKMLRAINLNREQIYIANVVKCRPPNNRDPLPQEVAQCLGYLTEQISIIRPKILLLLGRVASKNLLGKDLTLREFRKTTHQFNSIKTYVTYHPAALLRNSHLKKDAWTDLQKIEQELKALEDR
ncbi:MAG: uracil-DNA glycosylase [Candidatus Cloacimonetes bacterium]|nr:uracil-DNA glycosylase [Candidatus Cloacimonadota bacterium]